MSYTPDGRIKDGEVLAVGPCVRCRSVDVIEYGFWRRYCIGCGFTFHRESVDEQDELRRRKQLNTSGQDRDKESARTRDLNGGPLAGESR